MIELHLLAVSKTANWRISDWGGQSPGEDDTLQPHKRHRYPPGVICNRGDRSQTITTPASPRKRTN